MSPGAVAGKGEIIGIGLWLHAALLRLADLIGDAAGLGIGDGAVLVGKADLHLAAGIGR